MDKKEKVTNDKFDWGIRAGNPHKTRGHPELSMEQKRSMTKHIILQPFQEALQDLEITEKYVLKKYKELLDNPNTADAVVLRAVELFTKWLGLADKLDVSFDSELKEGLDRLITNREDRQKKDK